MKKIFFILFLLISIQMQSQNNTNSIVDFGKTFPIENPDLVLQKEKIHKVIFDVFKDGTQIDKANASIETVARFINMHTQQGVPLENLKIVVVLHGAAAKNSLNDEAFLKKYEIKNPNSPLLSALNNANVDIFVCGQSLASRGNDKSHMSKDVKLSLSALTALVHYQSLGYHQINFN